MAKNATTAQIKKIVQTVDSLDARWMHEKEYEDKKEYAAAARKLIAGMGFLFVSFKLAPTVLKFTDMDYSHEVKVAANGITHTRTPLNKTL